MVKNKNKNIFSKNYNYYTIHPKFKRNFDYKMLDNKLIIRNENSIKIIVII
jgi:predicted secreted Zn-dependent protease